MTLVAEFEYYTRNSEKKYAESILIESKKKKKNPDIFSGGMNQIFLRPFVLISHAAEDRTILLITILKSQFRDITQMSS
jgi:hypothetical protein